jgi:hypothetical protein
VLFLKLCAVEAQLKNEYYSYPHKHQTSFTIAVSDGIEIEEFEVDIADYIHTYNPIVPTCQNQRQN